MCTIMTTTGSFTTVPEFEEAFALTKYRGPDDTRIISIDRMEMVSSSSVPLPLRRFSSSSMDGGAMKTSTTSSYELLTLRPP